MTCRSGTSMQWPPELRARQSMLERQEMACKTPTRYCIQFSLGLSMGPQFRKLTSFHCCCIYAMLFIYIRVIFSRSDESSFAVTRPYDICFIAHSWYFFFSSSSRCILMVPWGKTNLVFRVLLHAHAKFHLFFLCNILPPYCNSTLALQRGRS